MITWVFLYYYFFWPFPQSLSKLDLSFFSYSPIIFCLFQDYFFSSWWHLKHCFVCLCMDNKFLRKLSQENGKGEKKVKFILKKIGDKDKHDWNAGAPWGERRPRHKQLSEESKLSTTKDISGRKYIPSTVMTFLVSLLFRALIRRMHKSGKVLGLGCWFCLCDWCTTFCPFVFPGCTPTSLKLCYNFIVHTEMKFPQFCNSDNST